MKTREIKFRGLDKNGSWRYGYYHAIHEAIQTYHYIRESSSDKRIDPVTLGQWTGLKDKNGKDIYEGDVIKFKVDFPDQEFDNGIVRWAAGGYWTSQTEDDLEELLSEELDDLEAEVIGNIYENSELLKETIERETKR